MSAADLNGKQGKVVGSQGEHVKVRFVDVGVKALKAQNLKLVEALPDHYS